MRIAIILVATLFTLSSQVVKADTYDVKLISTGLTIPWGMAFIDQDTLLVTERPGKIKKINIKSGAMTLLTNMKKVAAIGQGGLLDIALSPIESDLLYLTYTQSTTSGMVTTLASFRYQNGKINNQQDLFSTESATNTSRHFGSRITFDKNGHLYFSIGDRGVRDNGQDTSNHAGSILRLNLDGSLPSDNPFINKPSIRNEIWSYGHRNPQGLFYDQISQQLWSVEHGPRGGDEINLIQVGANYGWPITSHGKEYWGPFNVADYTEKQGIESPKLVYIPSIAPSSIVLYRGKRYPDLSGKLLVSALKLTHINVVSIQSNHQLNESKRVLEKLGERIRAIAISPDDFIYFSTDNGNIYKLLIRDR